MEKPRATKQGFHYNGWSLSWHVIAAVILVIGNAFVAQHRIAELEKQVGSVKSQLGSVEEQVREVEVIDNRIKNNSGAIEYHRLYEHGSDSRGAR